jgi:hypothetical protein
MMALQRIISLMAVLSCGTASAIRGEYDAKFDPERIIMEAWRWVGIAFFWLAVVLLASFALGMVGGFVRDILPLWQRREIRGVEARAMLGAASILEDAGWIVVVWMLAGIGLDGWSWEMRLATGLVSAVVSVHVRQRRGIRRKDISMTRAGRDP